MIEQGKNTVSMYVFVTGVQSSRLSLKIGFLLRKTTASMNFKIGVVILHTYPLYHFPKKKVLVK